MKKACGIIISSLLLGAVRLEAAEPAAPLSALAKLPVREVTVFKDGHAFVQHQGTLPTDADGDVLMDYLPTPVLGTFWPYSPDKDVKLRSVVASQRRVLVERTALTLREMLEANVGAQVLIVENNDKKYAATIMGVPQRGAAELNATNPPNTDEKLPQKGDIILLNTDEGLKVVAIGQIREIILKDGRKTSVANEEFRNLLTLNLDWGRRKAEKTARIGLIYLQKGLRWIPNYRVAIDGKGNADVKLQVTLINELTDLQDATANLVVGVPTFAFKDTLDPMALQQTTAQLSQYFRESSQTAYGMSNAIMTQAARMTEVENRVAAPNRVNLGPEVMDAGTNEDLFIFTVQHVTLKKGERMVLPVVEYSLKYKDVFVVTLPFAPPAEVRSNLNTTQQQEIARLLNAPKVMHKIRLFNKGQYPLTTAPALILRNGQLLAQNLMTYTSIGGQSDLDVTAAVDIKVSKSERETKRTPNAANWEGNQYVRADLAGKITLTSYRNQPVEVEVTRYVLGTADTADQNGVIDQTNAFEEARAASGEYPYWWGWYNWPHWWSHFNGIGRITWKPNLAPGKSVDLNYTWHYFWR
ncbi:MAG TPA: hypothetical protein VNA16_10610 [Abditibacteriaceae bacterium]|nr:hypothetical protein [Abditibacteriaceae bacterium]